MWLSRVRDSAGSTKGVMHDSTEKNKGDCWMDISSYDSLVCSSSFLLTVFFSLSCMRDFQSRTMKLSNGYPLSQKKIK